MTKPLASICIATHNKFPILDRVLQSIYAQFPPFDFEVIVVDDGSDDATEEVCLRHNNNRCSSARYNDLRYAKTNNVGYRNPGPARNVAMKMARGDVLICQSDDVVHHTPNTIEKLVNELYPNTYNIATVYNQFADGSLGEMYTGLANRRPYFFLGSVLRKHVYAIGGNDEHFTEPGYDDNWFACCLHRGLGLEVNYRPDIVGYHQDHPRPNQVSDAMKNLFWDRWDKAEHGRIKWQAMDGPWDWDDKNE